MVYTRYYSPSSASGETSEEQTMYTSRITTKGQVTIPADIRRLLRLSPKDKVSFVIEKDDVVKIEPAKSVVAQTAGMFKSDRPALSAKEERALAEEAFVTETMKQSS